MFPQKAKNGVLVLFATLLLPSLCICDPRSTSRLFDLPSETHVGPVNVNPNFKIPLPPSTSSVKCKCQTIESVAYEPSTSDIQSRSDLVEFDTVTDPQSAARIENGKEIEIQIFKSKKDLKNSEQPQKSKHNVNNKVIQNVRNFKVYRTTQFFEKEEIKVPDFLQLGETIGPFEGPRRRRRSAQSPLNKGVYYVYPTNTNFQNTTNEIANLKLASSTTKSITSFIYPESSTNSPKTSEEKNNGSFQPTPIPLSDFPNISTVVQDVENGSGTSKRDFYSGFTDPANPPNYNAFSSNPIHYQQLGQTQPYQLTPEYLYQLERKSDYFPGAGYGYGIPPTPTPIPVDREPGIFSSLVARYIDFEVNNHETADALRKVLFAFIIGTLIVAWIALGAFVGIFPLHLLFWNTEDEGKNKRSSEESARNNIDKLSDRVQLALESEWLKKLEAKVRKDPRGNFLRTIAKCCIIPDDNLVECKLVLKNKDSGKDESSPVSCVSELIYNFQFGDPDENDDE